MRVAGFQATNTAIQNPFTFFYVQNNDWSATHSYQFWNKNFTTAVGVNNDETLKTIYSPSPSGFVEPKTAAFTGFTSTGGNTSNGSQLNTSGSWNAGWYLYTTGWQTGGTIFFDSQGFRDTYNGRSGTGNIINYGQEGLFWTVGALNSAYGYAFSAGSGGICPRDEKLRSYGLECRPVLNN